MIDFNSPEWKEKLKGKSAEEIAKIVGEYYEAKYKKEYPVFPWKVLIAIIFFFLLIIIILIIFMNYLKKIAF
ncbi:MAG: hypothetical protein NC926_03455 [Candidatus Omnitrophica bacterium]|nr:hypothetical protein [Candidatus Omnitrophota bacterium]MCM8807001.1 hypothetical protein [Candidatus Omnitrophota bacterium]